jgi:hypothetical protein
MAIFSVVCSNPACVAPNGSFKYYMRDDYEPTFGNLPGTSSVRALCPYCDCITRLSVNCIGVLNPGIISSSNRDPLATIELIAQYKGPQIGGYAEPSQYDTVDPSRDTC